MKKTLTAKQQAALDGTRNIAVTAGAGTGKTFILVERYLDMIINQDADIRQVLAITFTKKAAAEMLTRIAERVTSQLGENTDPEKHRKLLEIRDHLSAAYISTIHSFCARILREYPVEAGIDPDFLQLSDMQFEVLFDEAFSEILAGLDKEQDYWLEVFRALRLAAVEQMLREALGRRYEMRQVLERYRSDPPEEMYARLIDNYLRDAQQQTGAGLLTRITVLADELLEYLRRKGVNDTVMRELAGFRRSDDRQRIEFWQSLIDLRTRFTTNAKKAYSNLRFLGGKDLWDSGSAPKVIELSECLAGLTDLPEPAPGPADLRMLRIMHKFFELYRRVEERFRGKKQYYNMVDYEDLQLLVYDLLRSDEALRQGIAERFRYIMVDEFQDTNPLQWAIIDMLGGPDAKKYFIVGDPKQSIYGFRNADVRVFQSVRQRFIRQAPEDKDRTDIVLAESFRFREQLAGFINRLFSGVMAGDQGIEWEVGYDPVICRRDDAAGGSVAIAFPGDDSQPAFMAAYIRNLRQEDQVEFGDIAVLLRTRNHLVEIEETLRQEAIPFKTIGGIGFFQRQEIYDVYHLVRFLITPADDIAVIGLLRSPLADISDAGIFMLAQIKEPAGYWAKLAGLGDDSVIPADDRQKLIRFRDLGQRWLYWRDRMSFNELLDLIFNQSGFRAVYAADLKAARYLANLDKVLDQAVELERSGFAALADFGEALQNLIRSQVQESEAPVDIEDKTTVKIMTIHQAKGLEFPVVILPYLEQQLRSEAYNQAIFDEFYGFAPSFYDADSTGFLQQAVRRQARRKATAELKRLFYVGCTRARDRLLLLGTVRDGKVPAETPAAWLVDTLALDPGTLEEGVLNAGVSILRSPPAGGESIRPQPARIMQNIRTVRDRLSLPARPQVVPGYFGVPADHPKGEIFSATQLMIFDRSPGEYYARYHLGYFASDYDFSLRLGSEEDIAMLRGKLIHKYFEEFPAFDLQRTLYEYEITDTEIVGRLTEQVQATIGRIGRSAGLAEILSAGESINELSATCKIGEDFLTGTIDRMYRNREGVWEIIDYKTNRISQRNVAAVSREYQLQLLVYALLLAGLYPEQEYYRVNLYFTHIDVLRPEIFTPEDLPACAQKVLTVIDGIKRFAPYAPSPPRSKICI